MNLKKLYGDRYRISKELKSENSTENLIIKGKHGHVYVHGKGLLGASSNSARSKASRLLRTIGSTVQDGDDGVNVVFDPQHFPEVAEILGLYKKRQISDAHKAKLREAGANYRFSAGLNTSLAA